MHFVKELNPCRTRSFSDTCRALFASLNTFYRRIIEKAFLWGEQDKNLSSPGRMTFIVLRLQGFSSYVSGFYVNTFQHGGQFCRLRVSIGTGMFLSFFQAKIGRERLVYFIVSTHSVLFPYFTEWLGWNLRRSKFEGLLVTFFTFKDVDSIFCWLFCTFPEQHLRLPF